MYLRFVVAEKDEDSGRRKGVFAAAYDLRRDGKLLAYEEERVTESIEWFKKNLKTQINFQSLLGVMQSQRQ